MGNYDNYLKHRGVVLPDPERPVKTTSDSFGIVTETFFKLFYLAPLMVMFFSISVFILTE